MGGIGGRGEGVVKGEVKGEERRRERKEREEKGYLVKKRREARYKRCTETTL